MYQEPKKGSMTVCVPLSSIYFTHLRLLTVSDRKENVKRSFYFLSDLTKGQFNLLN